MCKFKIGDPVIINYSGLDLFIDIVSNEQILHRVNENKFDEVFEFKGTLEQANEIIRLQALKFRLKLKKDNYSDKQRIKLLTQNIYMMIASHVDLRKL